MILVKENEVYKVERTEEYTLEEKITFKQPKEFVYNKEPYDWYMTVALGKSDKVIKDRHLLTADLLLEYRGAIREGYMKEFDPNLDRKYAHPKNRNTIKGIKAYIDKIGMKHQAFIDELINT